VTEARRGKVKKHDELHGWGVRGYWYSLGEGGGRKCDGHIKIE